VPRADRLVTRAQWGARAPEGRTPFTPEFGGTVHYSEVPAAASHLSCPSQVRAIQAYHMDQQGWTDLAYSDLACQHGAIYEGRGGLIRTAANGTNTGNDQAHAVCALLAAGQTPSAAMLDAIVDSLVWLNSRPGAGDGVNGHRDWKATGCPGDPLYGHVPTIRARVLAGLNPTAPIPPLPPAVWGPRYPEESMRQLLVFVPVGDDDNDGDGRGYIDLRAGVAGLTEDVPFSKVMAATYAGADPASTPVGWKARALAPVELVNRGGLCRLLVPEHQVKSGNVGVYVAVAD